MADEYPLQRMNGETMQQFSGRQKRWINTTTDALNLRVGDPVQYKGRMARFELRMIDRKKPTRITRLEGDWLELFLTQEAARNAEREQFAERQRQHDAFYSRPEVKAADSIRYNLESDLALMVEKLTPQEWIELAAKLKIK